MQPHSHSFFFFVKANKTKHASQANKLLWQQEKKLGHFIFSLKAKSNGAIDPKKNK